MYPKSLEPKKRPSCGANFSLLRAISTSNPQVTTLRDLVTNSSSSTDLTIMLFRHLCSMQKPRDSMTVVFNDHGMCDDMDTELHLDFPVLSYQQSTFEYMSYRGIVDIVGSLGYPVKMTRSDRHSS
jgi:hypothetical protein